MLWLLCCVPASHPAILSARQVDRPRCHDDTRRQNQQCVRELERLSPACWSFSSRRLNYDRVSPARSGNVRDVANATSTSGQLPPCSCRRGCTSCAAATATATLLWMRSCTGSDIPLDWLRHSDFINVQLTVSV